jgi:hypothetical protein
MKIDCFYSLLKVHQITRQTVQITNIKIYLRTRYNMKAFLRTELMPTYTMFQEFINWYVLIAKNIVLNNDYDFEH